MTVSDELAREICRYCFEHDVLTQHGMKGLREKIQKALTGADALHEWALKRVEKLMDASPAKDSDEGRELDGLVVAISEYERCLIPSASAQ